MTGKTCPQRDQKSRAEATEMSDDGCDQSIQQSIKPSRTLGTFLNEESESTLRADFLYEQPFPTHFDIRLLRVPR